MMIRVINFCKCCFDRHSEWGWRAVTETNPCFISPFVVTVLYQAFPRIPPVLLAEGEGEVCARGTSAGNMLRCLPWCASVLSRVWLLATPRTAACQATLSVEFSRQETGVGCHFLLQGIFLTQGSKPHLPSALAGGFFTMVPPGKPLGPSSAASWRWGWSQCPWKNPG